MAQYHYVLGYDTGQKSWFVELDTTAYFVDGNVFDWKMAADTGYGWKIPEDDSSEAVLDQTLLNTLYSLVDIIPIPKEHENVIA